MPSIIYSNSFGFSFCSFSLLYSPSPCLSIRNVLWMGWRLQLLNFYCQNTEYHSCRCPMSAYSVNCYDYFAKLAEMSPLIALVEILFLRTYFDFLPFFFTFVDENQFMKILFSFWNGVREYFEVASCDSLSHLLKVESSKLLIGCDFVIIFLLRKYGSISKNFYYSCYY